MRKLFTLLLLFISYVGYSQVIIDNTANGTVALTTSLGSVTATNFQGKVFTTPAELSSGNLSKIKLSLYNTSANGAATINFNLYLADANNFPTGSALSSQSFGTTLTTTPTYYDFNLTSANWPLAASKKYVLVVSGTTASGTISWTTTNTSHTTSSSIAYVGTVRSTNSGSTWGTNSYLNGIQITATNLVLPVTLTQFSANLSKSGILSASWKTASEKNNSHFILQGSTDGKEWSNLATKNAVSNGDNGAEYNTEIDLKTVSIAGFGLVGLFLFPFYNRRSRIIAAFIVCSLFIVSCSKQSDELSLKTESLKVGSLKGTIYLRLAQVDKDGTVNYSHVISVKAPN
ncbi:choice-of-anchor R domain-containing protein [Nubsella zeaxanthinifaciens]|uniref:choice-of-anchor R domain-containing protein n=1 Tax=Nubsella zeaxanthinifaciens TaxID=392412 RepID=UPI003D07D027